MTGGSHPRRPWSSRAESSTRTLWLVDPAERFLECLTLDGDRWVRLGAWDDTAVARIAPFEEVELEIARLFPPDQ